MRWPITVAPVDLLDIGIVAALIFVMLAGWRRIRIRAVARVLVAVVVFYISVHAIGLRLAIQLLNVSAVVVALVVVIAYHTEIRRAMERIVAQLTRRVVQPRRGLSERGATAAALPGWAEAICAASVEMAGAHTGAVIVVRGRDPLDRHLNGGTPLDAIVSESLLLSIFDPHSMGHDGALVVDGGRAVGFQHHLPLSQDHDQLQRRGTRHAAALGLAERCDAMSIVVSEERGTVSVARDGQLRKLATPDDVRAEFAAFLPSHDPHAAMPASTWGWPVARPALASIAIAAVLWFFLIHEGAIEYRTFVVPIEFTGLDDGRRIVAVQPAEAKVILAGPRRAFYFVHDRSVSMTVPLFDTAPGDHELTLTASEISRPPGVEFANIFPRQLSIRIE